MSLRFQNVIFCLHERLQHIGTLAAGAGAGATGAASAIFPVLLSTVQLHFLTRGDSYQS
jgi:hypothetical protein